MDVLTRTEVHGWVHPLCDPCARQSALVTITVASRPDERCCSCGRRTRSGIFARIDPASPDLLCPRSPSGSAYL